VPTPTPEAGAGQHPYSALTPDRVLDALAAIGLVGDGRLMALNSFENRVYLVHLEQPSPLGPAVVVKFYRPGRWSDAQILQEHAFATELMIAEVPVVAPLSLGGGTLHQWQGFAYSVSPMRGGRMPELDDGEVLEWTGRFLARLHNVGARRPFELRPTLDLHRQALAAREFLLHSPLLPLDLRSTWEKAASNAIDLIAANAIQISAAGQKHHASSGHGLEPLQSLRLHGDCHPGNILWTPLEAPADRQPGPHFVDLDDCCNGPAVQDLWMLVSGSRSERTRALASLIDGYEQLRPFDRRELALIEPLRTLRILHYSAWLARRWDDPTFPIHFPWFGSSDYWAGQVQMLQDQLAAMQDPPLSL